MSSARTCSRGLILKRTLSAIAYGGQVESYVADLSRMADVEALAKAVAEKHAKLDVLINNAGVIFWGDHGNNIVSSRGILPASRELFLKKIEHTIADHPVTEQEVLLTSAW